MTREFMVASTVPSTTSVSQSVISTPLSLILGPTVSLLPLASSKAGAAGGVAARMVLEEEAPMPEPLSAEGPPAGPEVVPLPVADASPVAELRVEKLSFSRLPKNGFCTAMAGISLSENSDPR